MIEQPEATCDLLCYCGVLRLLACGGSSVDDVDRNIDLVLSTLDLAWGDEPDGFGRASTYFQPRLAAETPRPSPLAICLRRLCRPLVPPRPNGLPACAEAGAMSPAMSVATIPSAPSSAAVILMATYRPSVWLMA